MVYFKYGKQRRGALCRVFSLKCYLRFVFQRFNPSLPDALRCEWNMSCVGFGGGIQRAVFTGIEVGYV